MKVKIFGIETEKNISLADKFDVMCEDSDRVIAFSKETFEHREDGLNFDYKYAIEGMIVENHIYYSLYLVPTVTSLTEDKLASVTDCCGIEEDEVGIWDVFDYGCYILMGSHCEDYDEEVGIKDEVLDNIASVYEVMDCLKGFYLDKPQNRMGTSGWDWLKDYVNGEDAIKATIAKYKK